MTTVEDAAAFVDAPSRGAKLLQRPRATTGPWSWVTTVDHKKIAIMYGTLALTFFVVAGIEALFIRLQLATPNGTLLTAARYNEFFTMHGTTMVFLAGMPIAAAFGNYLVPLMIGARDVAFPRLNMLGLLDLRCSAGCSSTRRSCSVAHPTAAGSDTRRSRAPRSPTVTCRVEVPTSGPLD